MHALEWYNQLPEPQRTQAIQNYSASNIRELCKNQFVRSPISLQEAVAGGFVWSATPEGGDYWANISNQLLKAP